MSSHRVPTINFAHLPPAVETSGSFARTDGSDHKLKQQLKDAGTIMSCIVVQGRARLEARPYPRDAQGRAIALSDLKDYAATHTWLDNIHCFCESMFGTPPRPVRIITPTRGSWAKHVVLGCQEWRATGKAEKGKREFCLYWLDLTDLVPTPRFAHTVQLEVFPLRAHSYAGADLNGSNDVIRQILGHSGGPSSSQDSGAPSSSQASGAPLSSQSSLTKGTKSRASQVSHSRQHSTGSNDSTTILLSNPIERKPKRQLYPKGALGATATRFKPAHIQPVKAAKATPGLPEHIIEISDDEPGVSVLSTHRAKRVKITGPLPGPVIELSDAESPPPSTQPSGHRIKPAQARARPAASAPATPPAPTARKHGRAVDEAEVVVVSDDDTVGGESSRPDSVVRNRPAVKKSMRRRAGHMSTRGGNVLPPVAGPSSQGVAAAGPPPSEPDVFTVDGQAPGSQGAAFVAMTSSVTGKHVIYQLAGKD